MSIETSTDTRDVLIVGGGPAGLACAVALGKQGVSVHLVERCTWPVDKVCGEGLMPCGVDTLRRLGVFDLIPSSECRPFRGIRWVNEDGLFAHSDFASGTGYGVRRVALSEAPHRRAQAFPTVKLSAETKVMAIETDPSGVMARVMTDGDEYTIKARVVIGADGHRSMVRKSVGLEGAPAIQNQRWGARQHFRVEPWSDHVEVYWSDGIEAYVTPSAADRVEVAFLWDRKRIRPAPAGRALLQGLLQHFPSLAERLDHVESITSLKATGPLAVESSTADVNRCLLIGDALGYVDGITGEGVSVALKQAEHLGKELPQILEAPVVCAQRLKHLSLGLRTMYRETVPLVRMAIFLSGFAALRRLVIRGLTRAPRLFTHFLEVNMGRRPIWLLPVRALPLFLLGTILPRTRQKPLNSAPDGFKTASKNTTQYTGGWTPKTLPKT